MALKHNSYILTILHFFCQMGNVQNGEAMKTSSRQILVLQLFEREKPVWTVEQMTRTLKLPESTVYRHVRNLVAAGFLDPVNSAGYTLGPAFIRYESIIRATDALIQHAEPVMAALLERTAQTCTVFLSRRFRDCVMCVHEVRGSRSGETGYGRGVAMPMFLGATSKVILAQLPPRTLKAVYLDNESAIRRSLNIRDWNEFHRSIKEIRRAGFAMTKSEVSKERTGIAAPITRNGQSVASLTLSGIGWSSKKADQYIQFVRAAATEISDTFANDTAMISR